MTIFISKKSRTTALILAFFFGGFGLHRFYVRKSGTAALQLLLTISLVGLPVCFIWVWVDIITIANGVFKDKYGDLITAW